MQRWFPWRMSSPGSIRLFTAILLLIVGWQWWRGKGSPVTTPPPPASPAGEAPSKEKSLFPDE